MLSSVYFDSVDAYSFKERMYRAEGSRLLRFRWYGDNDGSGEKRIFIERKIHHEGWAVESSKKERFALPQRHIASFIRGTFDIDGWFDSQGSEEPGCRELAHEVHRFIQERKLFPMIRTSYFRCAFQRASSNQVRISLDTQMTLINEAIQGGFYATGKKWCRETMDLLSEDDIFRFPHAILEIKLQEVEDTPEWATRMCLFSDVVTFICLNTFFPTLFWFGLLENLVVGI